MPRAGACPGTRVASPEGMRSLIASAGVAALLLCGDSAGDPVRPSAERALPWLHDFPADAAADAPSRGAEIWLIEPVRPAPAPDRRAPAPACTTSSSATFALVAELWPTPGPETILASYTSGVVLLDATGRRLAAAPPLACSGSADAIVGLAVGELLPGEPVIALAAAAGGRAERTTWLLLLAPRGEALAPIFAVPVEEQRGEATWSGDVTRLPGGALRYRSPAGAVSRWTYDRGAGRFLLRELIRPSAEGAGGPSA